MHGQATPVSTHQASITRHFRTWLAHAAAFALAGGVLVSAAAAQEAIVRPGDAVVTGFAGVAATQAPPGADPFDYIGIDLAGASARVVDLSELGPQGGESAAPKIFTITPAQVGQVFGVALDDADPPNIYLAATSAYGLSIAVPDASGQLKRVQRGQAGAQFVPGQFGPPEMGGGPGSIWRVDGLTGEVSLFADAGASTTGPASLGGLAYDPATRQIFAADRSTGIVYRYGLDGTQQGSYDHGVEGRPDAGLPAVPLPAAVPVDITSPAFDTTNPATWGFAAPARRVFALAVHDHRLFYSIKQGPQVWSVQINANGTVSGGARMEVEVPSLQDGVEITSIAFDGQGRMYLAERGATTGDYTMYALANGGQSRVLRYLPDGPGHWQPAPEQYSVGLAPNYANADGGVALGYGYTQQGDSYAIDTGACGATVWTTGGRLLDPGDPSAAPGSFPYVDGLQGNAIDLVQPQNTPPTASWFVDYDDKAGYPDMRGYMGAIATLPCAGPSAPPVVCPPGTYFDGNQCIIIPSCPPGTTYQNGQCVYPTCPPGYYVQNGQCVPPPVSCPPGTFYYKGQCFPVSCPPGLVKQPNGQCACPSGEVFYNGKCVPPQSCPPPMIKLPNGLCWCPLDMIFGNGSCQVLPKCLPGQEIWNGKCVPKCPPGFIHKPPNGACKPPVTICPPPKEVWNGKCVNKCPTGFFHSQPNGACKPIIITPPLQTLCLPPKEKWNGKCVAKCPPGQVHTAPNGACKFIIKPPLQTLCLPPKEIWNGKCVAKCPPGQVHTLPNGACKLIIKPPLQTLCLPPKEKWNGKCVNKCPPGQVHTLPNGACKLIIKPPLQTLCLPPKEKWNGKCVNKCPPGQVHTLPNGACKLIIKPPLQTLCLPPKEKWNGKCVNKCPPGQVHTLPNGACKLIIKPPLQTLCLPPKEKWNGKCVNKCPPGQVHTLPNGACKLIIKPPLQTLCLPPKEKWNGKCVNKCPPGQVHTLPNGACKLIIKPPLQTLCLPPKEKWNGKCVNKCPPGQVHTLPNGACKLIIKPPLQTLCLPPKEKWNGQCVDKCAPGQVHTAPNGDCKFLVKPILPILCLAPKEIWEGKCVDKCPPGKVHTLPNGACVFKPPIIQPTPQPKP